MKIDLNVSSPKSGKQDAQYDIVLYNDESIAIIEIKYKASKNDINDLIRKAGIFRDWFPEYSDYKIYLGIAGMSFLKNTVKNAEAKGIAVIRQRGGKTIVNDKNLKAYWAKSNEYIKLKSKKNQERGSLPTLFFFGASRMITNLLAVVHSLFFLRFYGILHRQR